MTRKTRQYPDPAQRIPLLAERQSLKMARSAHAYVRGSTQRFYEWLDASNGALPQYRSVSIVKCPEVSRKPLEEGHPAIPKGA